MLLLLLMEAACSEQPRRMLLLRLTAKLLRLRLWEAQLQPILLLRGVELLLLLAAAEVAECRCCCFP